MNVPPSRARRFQQHVRRQVGRFLPEPGPIATVLVVGVVAAIVYGAYVWLDPTPAKHIVMATGPEQGAYAEFARRYVPLLKSYGVTLELRPTQGSAENLALLRDPDSGVQVAFVQGGVDRRASDAATADSDDDPELVSLGAVAYEPLWLFYREDAIAPRAAAGKGATKGKDAETDAAPGLARFAGKRINIGPKGGGSGALVQRVAALAGLPAGTLHDGDASTTTNVLELVQGRTDALAMVSAPEAPFVRYLLHTPGIALFDVVHADAFARRLRFLHSLRLPRGLFDPAADLPPRDLRMVAATASLVARADLHPALVQLLVQAAKHVHGHSGWFVRAGEFPNVDAPIFPVSDEAARFYRNGPPLLQRYLPFWLANFIDRMWIVLLPLIAALVPLSRVLPPLVAHRMRSRVFRWYGRLRSIEDNGDRPRAELMKELDDIEARVAGVQVPLSYADELYALKLHIGMVRQRLADERGPA